MQKIRKGDDVIIRTGKDKGRSGRVLKTLKNNKVIVENINQVKKSVKPNPNIGVVGGFIEKDMPIDISNIGLFNPVTKKIDRVGIRILVDGKKARFFKSTNELVDG